MATAECLGHFRSSQCDIHWGNVVSRARYGVPTSSLTARTRFSPALGTFLLLLALNLFNYIDRYILPGELSLIQDEFHATRQEMGALTTAMFFVYMLAAPLTGWLGDRFSRKPLIIGGALLWSL